MNRLLISAAHKSSGKTTVSIGLAAALARAGHTVQTFKKGPDYIDPMWLGRASGRSCYNLDFYLSSNEEIAADFCRRSQGADLALVEGNKGLHDGMDLDGSSSNAALAKLLAAPVVLVVDTRGITRGVAPLLLGYQSFDPAVTIAGVILNQVGGSRHEAKLVAAVEHYTDIPVLGALHRDPALTIDERHLGLIPSNETAEAQALVNAAADAVASSVNLDQVVAVAATAPALECPAPEPIATAPAADVRIGIARDAAFGFYYPGDLEALRQSGAELVTIDLIHDTRLPEVDGLFIGGGFPETQMAALSANRSMRESVRVAVEDGLPCYAECGGLMYLARSIEWHGQRQEMVGIIPGEIVMHDRPVGRGYTRVRETTDHPWQTGAASQAEYPAHEFHHSSLEKLGEGRETPGRFAYEVLRGTGINGDNDGYCYKNLLASYIHLRHVRDNPWTDRFVEFVRRNARHD